MVITSNVLFENGVLRLVLSQIFIKTKYGLIAAILKTSLIFHCTRKEFRHSKNFFAYYLAFFIFFLYHYPAEVSTS